MQANTDQKDGVKLPSELYAGSLAKRVSDTTQMDHGYTAILIKLASAIAMGLFVFAGPLAALSVSAVAIGGSTVALPAFVFVIPATVMLSALKSLVQLGFHYGRARDARRQLQTFIDQHNANIKDLVTKDADYAQRVEYRADLFYEDSVGLRNLINKALDSHLENEQKGDKAWESEYNRLLEFKHTFEQSGGSNFHFHSLRYKQHTTMFIKKVLIFLVFAAVIGVTFFSPAGMFLTPSLIAGVLLANGIMHVRNAMVKDPERFKSMHFGTRVREMSLLFAVGVVRKLPFARELSHAGLWIARQGKRSLTKMNQYKGVDALRGEEHVKLATYVDLFMKQNNVVDIEELRKLQEAIRKSNASHPLLREAQNVINGIVESNNGDLSSHPGAMKQVNRIKNELISYVRGMPYAVGSDVPNDHITPSDIHQRSQINPSLALQTVFNEVLEPPAVMSVVTKALREHVKIEAIAGVGDTVTHSVAMHSPNESHTPGIAFAHHLLGFTYPAMAGFQIADDITYQRHLRALWQQLDPVEFKKKNRLLRTTVSGRMAYDLLYRRLPDVERGIRRMCILNPEAMRFITKAHEVIEQKAQSGLYHSDDVHQAKTNVFLLAKRMSELHNDLHELRSTVEDTERLLNDPEVADVKSPHPRASIEDIKSDVNVKVLQAERAFNTQMQAAHAWLNSPLSVMEHQHKSIGMFMH